jgi:hypothetical protein
MWAIGSIKEDYLGYEALRLIFENSHSHDTYIETLLSLDACRTDLALLCLLTRQSVGPPASGVLLSWLRNVEEYFTGKKGFITSKLWPVDEHDSFSDASAYLLPAGERWQGASPV